MNTTLTPTDPDLQAIETALVKGDLAGLTVEQRIRNYARVCESVGLNPNTQPFDYITLQGRLQLYARRTCTDQLRKLNGVSVMDVKEDIHGDILTVHVAVKDKEGREDRDKGCVNLQGLKGDALANAHMKCL